MILWRRHAPCCMRLYRTVTHCDSVPDGAPGKSGDPARNYFSALTKIACVMRIFCCAGIIGRSVDLAAIMNWLWIFVALCPLAFALLIAFAAHIDPLSGRWRAPSAGARRAMRPSGSSLASALPHCLQRITIDRFLMFAPKMPPTEPPAVAPLSASFDTTS